MDWQPGGSPRFALNTSAGNVFVYLGDLPSFTCPGGVQQSSGNLIGNEDACRYDTSQIQPGTQCNTYSGTVVLLDALGLQITGIQLVVDAGWAFADGEQTVVVDPHVVIS